MNEDEKRDRDVDLEQLKQKKEMWDKVVDTQMHFNEMCVKTRQLGLTFVVAALSLAAILVARGASGIQIPFFGNLHVSALIVLAAAIGLYVVKMLDLGVYHRMLRGAVAFGEKLEEEMKSDGLFSAPKGMTQSISTYSRFDNVDDVSMDGKSDRVSAYDRIAKFYIRAIFILIVVAVALALAFKNHGAGPSPELGKSEKTSLLLPPPEKVMNYLEANT